MTTERMRVIWENTANEHLEKSGHKVRIDSRSLEEQGIERKATVHEGVKARQMTARGERPQSKVVQFPNAPTARSEGRSVDYCAIDGGTTRQEYNAQIITLSGRLSKNDEKKLVGKVKLPDNFEYARHKNTRRNSTGQDSRTEVRNNQLRGANEDHSRNEGKRRSTGINRWGSSFRPDAAGHSPNAANLSKPNPEVGRVASRARGLEKISRHRTLIGSQMTDEEIYKRRIAELKDEKDKDQARRDLYRETYERECFNAREYADKRQTYEEAESNNKAARNVRKTVIADLERSEKGREFLQKEAHEVRADVYAKDEKIRSEKAKLLEQQQAKALEEQKAKEADEAAKQLPRSAEVVAEEVKPDEGKKKAAEIMAFLAAQEEKQQQQPPAASSHEKERKRDRDNEWEPE